MASHIERSRPYHPIYCWACEELLALVGRRDHRLIVEADAETTADAGGQVIVCACGASTILPGDGALDAP